jgi:hypothetical protein
MDCACAVDVTMRRVRPAASISVDPLQPVFSAVACREVLEVVRGWDVLRFGGTQEVILDWVRVVAKGDFDGCCTRAGTSRASSSAG